MSRTSEASPKATPWVEEKEPQVCVSFAFADERWLALRYDHMRFMEWTQDKISIAFEHATITLHGHALKALGERLCEQRVVSIHEQRLALIHNGGDAPFIRCIEVSPPTTGFCLKTEEHPSL